MQTTTDVLADILLLLPVKTLTRFKIVSNTWYKLISESWYVNSHCQRSRFNPRVLCMRRGSLCRSLSFTSVDGERNLSENFTKSLSWDFFDYVHCVSSYNDLICFMTPMMDVCMNIYLYNPVIHRVFALPESKNPPNLPFSMSSSTREYKVLRFYQNDSFYTKFEIFTFCDVNNLSSSWRTIKLKISERLVPLQKSLVLLHESFYWLSDSLSSPHMLDQIVVSFDLRNEKFNIILLPSELKSCTLSDHPLTLLADDFEGELSLIQQHKSLWVLKDYEKKHIWVRTYDIDLKPMFYPGLPKNYPSIFGYMINGELRILSEDSNRKFYCLYVYNVKSQEFRRVRLPVQLKNEFRENLFGFYRQNLMTMNLLQ